MKLLAILSLFLLTSCGSIKETANIEKSMKTYTFNASATKVYAAAKGYFNKKYELLAYLGDKAEIIDAKKYHGNGTWLEKQSELGGAKFMEKSRMIIRVKSKGKNKATLVISEQRMTKISGDWTDAGTYRMPIHEYNVLKELDATAAATVKKAAAAKK